MFNYIYFRTAAELFRLLIELLQFDKATSNYLGLGINTGQILGLCPAKERRRYFVTPSLLGWAQA